MLYCQNLSLFGKLFIDIKTLFFDCDNCTPAAGTSRPRLLTIATVMFYILTDADSTRDHVLGFFSKEKVSYDDYNLACIVVLPPYQRVGYGMLLIEFSESTHPTLRNRVNNYPFAQAMSYLDERGSWVHQRDPCQTSASEVI